MILCGWLFPLGLKLELFSYKVNVLTTTLWNMIYSYKNRNEDLVCTKPLRNFNFALSDFVNTS